MKYPYKLFLSVGEASGDILAINLMKDLKANPECKFKFYGIAGERMIKEGDITSIFPSKELSITGYLEILPKLSDGSDGCWRWGINTVNQRINELEAKFISTSSRSTCTQALLVRSDLYGEKRKNGSELE